MMVSERQTYANSVPAIAVTQRKQALPVMIRLRGSLQIVRKVFPNAYTTEEIASAAVAPLKVLPL